MNQEPRLKVIIYGKDHCPNCAKSKMLCQMRSIDFDYHSVGHDISIEDLHQRIGHPATSLPQIFLHDGETTRHIGGYEALRAAL